MNLLINIDVDDLAKAVDFYMQAFDLRVGRRFGGDAIELLGGPVPLYLLVKCGDTQATREADARRNYGRHWTPVHLDIVVTDMEGAIRKALAAGATLERPAKLSAWGELALLADPFGNGFCLVRFVGRGYDEIATP